MTQMIYTLERSHWKHASFICEKTSLNYIPHDALFKSLLKNYFKEFSKAFLPQAYEKLNFATVDFLSEEMIIDPFEDDVQFLDIVAKIHLKQSGEPVIIHVEPQSYRQCDFTERMFRYANALYNRLKIPMINIAVFNFQETWDEDQFTLKVHDYKTYEFNYQYIHLRSLDWQDFKEISNPVTATLMCLMKHDDADRINLKVAFLRMLVKSGIDIDQGKFFLKFFDQYLPFTREENKEVMERLKQEPETFDIDSLPIGIEELAKEEGEKLGLEKGEKIGIVKGEKLGLEKGHKLGTKKEKERIALSMLEDDLPLSKIAQYTNLTEKEIDVLKKQSSNGR